MERFAEDSESEIEYDELWREHLIAKGRKSKRRNSGKRKAQRLCGLLIGCSGWKPSVWPDGNWNSKTAQYEYNGRIKRAKNSNQQRWMKRYGNRVVRRHPEPGHLPKGNFYRKQFDYWWTWL